MKKQVIPQIVFMFILLILLIFSINSPFNMRNNHVKDTFSKICSWGYKPIAYIKKIYQLSKTNDQMHMQLLDYQYLQDNNANLQENIEALQQLLELNTSLASYQRISATVISYNHHSWTTTVTVDKGTNNNVALNMIVISSSGVIGTVIDVSPNTAQVQLLTMVNKNYKLSVAIDDGQEYCYGLLSQYDDTNNTFHMTEVSNTCMVTAGMKVVTSGLTNDYPQGLTIGYVMTITSDTYNISKDITVKSAQDFNNIRYVLVIK